MGTDNIRALSKVIFLVSVIDVALCDVTYPHDITRDEVMNARSTIANQSNDFYLLSPEKLFLFIEQEHKHEFNFSIVCHLEGEVILEFKSKHATILEVTENSSLKLNCPPENISTDRSGTSATQYLKTHLNGSVLVTFRGNRLGVVDLIVTVTPTVLDAELDVNGSRYRQYVRPVAVLRYIRLLDKIFLAVVPLLIVLVMIGFGCKLDLEVVKECVRKPMAPGIGFGCQYILMPLLGFTIAKLVPTGDKGVSLGIFLCGVCPGGGVSNIYTYLLDGDVSLSITMTFVSTVASIGMMPLWIYTLGRVFTNDQTDLIIPYVDLLQITALVAIPLMFGVFLKLKCHKVTKIYIKIHKPITVICVLFVVTVGIFSNLYLFKMFKPIHLVAGCLLPYLGYTLGGGIAAIFRLPWIRVKTIAIETGLQNVGVAYILLMKSFAPPYGDIAALAPAASGLMTPLPLLLITIVYLIYKRCTRTYEPVQKEQGPYNKNKEIGNGIVEEEAVTKEMLSSV